MRPVNSEDARQVGMAVRAEAELRKARLVESTAGGRVPFTTVADAIDREEKRDADLEALKAMCRSGRA